MKEVFGRHNTWLVLLNLLSSFVFTDIPLLLLSSPAVLEPVLKQLYRATNEEARCDAGLLCF